MPPRFAYWTIILEGKPTAFRAHLREDLLPTFKQLQARHPDVVLKWFARGRLWESPEDAVAAQRRGGRETRSPQWRPGGEHRDPRERFKIPRDEKRRRMAVKLRRESGGRDRRDADRGQGDSAVRKRPALGEPSRPRDRQQGKPIGPRAAEGRDRERRSPRDPRAEKPDRSFGQFGEKRRFEKPGGQFRQNRPGKQKPGGGGGRGGRGGGGRGPAR